jgi:hypothetical protein
VKKAKKRAAAGEPAGPVPRPKGGRDEFAGTVPVAGCAALGDVEAVLAVLADEGFPVARMTAARAARFGAVAGSRPGALIAAFIVLVDGPADQPAASADELLTRR